MRYALLLASDAGAKAAAGSDWLTEATWHDAVDYRVDGGTLSFRVPAGVANGLKRGERYALALTDAALNGMVRGEILWEDQPPLWALGPPIWTSGTSDSVAKVAPAPRRDKSLSQPQPSPKRGFSHWDKVSVALLATLATGITAGIWLALPGRDLTGPEQPTLAQFGTNPAPILATQSTASTGRDTVVGGATPETLAIETPGTLGSEPTVAREPQERPEAISDEPVRVASVARPPEPASRTRPAPASESERTPRPLSAPRSQPESAKTSPMSSLTPAQSKVLRTRIADALDAEDLQLVRSLCGEAMEVNASLAKFCGIVFDPNKRLFDAHPDAAFALACYDQAARLGDPEAGALAAAVRPFVTPVP